MRRRRDLGTERGREWASGRKCERANGRMGDGETEFLLQVSSFEVWRVMLVVCKEGWISLYIIITGFIL